MMFQKSTKRETQTKNSRARGIARLFLYKLKVFVRRDWFGLCENSHNAKAKNSEGMKRFGVMLDMSRNAVMKPEEVKRFAKVLKSFC